MFQHVRAPRPPLYAAVAALLLALGLLATLQYRWVGQIGEAERARLQAGARTRVEQLAQDFDREVTRAFALLQVDEDMLGPEGGAAYATRYERWASRTEHPGLVEAVYVVTGEHGARVLRRFDKADRAFVAAEWPAAFSRLRARLEGTEGGPGRLDRANGPRGPFGVVTDDVPVLVSPIFAAEPPGEGAARARPRRPRRLQGSRRLRAHAQHGPPDPAARPRLHRARSPPALAGRYFASGGEFDYCVVVTARRDPRTIVYRSDPADGLHAGRTPPPASSRCGSTSSTAGLLPPRAMGPFPRSSRAGLRATRGGGGCVRPPGPRPLGGRASPIARARSSRWWRTCAAATSIISFGILLLLGASAAMIVLSSQRARRLADQHVEFVAGVSHELRTPVAVVCSAGENLADGLVRDPAEVRVYGATIRDEGRRLAEMIEQVLEFAGIDSRERHARARADRAGQPGRRGRAEGLRGHPRDGAHRR